ncbi:unnamed protein product [Polarella glacialis]|uniref:Methyltransferase type 11 domain-containing protein n=1 Tax=Polarella glacialis TaxID=89957 RepID=A0A813HUK0_POLGL|nr:unnamed protein product [Polarella glacialis]
MPFFYGLVFMLWAHKTALPIAGSAVSCATATSHWKSALGGHRRDVVMHCMSISGSFQLASPHVKETSELRRTRPGAAGALLRRSRERGVDSVEGSRRKTDFVGYGQWVPVDHLEHFPAGSLDVVVDAGPRLAEQGLVMDLTRFRWDALGKVEELLRLAASDLMLLRQGGRFITLITGEPREFLVGFLASFPVEVREPPGQPSNGPGLFEFVVTQPVTPEILQAVLEREVLSERSHRRYANVLQTTLSNCSQQLGVQSPRLLDVGGGDGHMAEWWADMGYDVSLLEVDPSSASAAAQRLGGDKVTLHDGVSAWPYPDNSFDVCLLLFVLHHIASEESVRRTLSEAARVSRHQVLVMEDQPRDAPTSGLCRLAVAVTAEHFRPFGQDPAKYMYNIRSDAVWRALFVSAGLRMHGTVAIPGTLQHPVAHRLYDLRPPACLSEDV